MDHTAWQKQTKELPLFNDLLWSRPENQLHAGKLLVIGGNGHGFAAPAAVYAAAGKAGIGTCRVLLPEALHKTVGKVFPAAEYAASTAASGGFARAALNEWLSQSMWADGVCMAGDIGHNSETAILIETYLEKFGGLLTIVNDTVDHAIEHPSRLLDRPNTTLVCTMPQLQKMAANAKSTKPITSTMALLQLADALYTLTREFDACIVTLHDSNVVVAKNGQISSTRLTNADLTSIAAGAAVWWLQNSSRQFDAITTSLIS